MPRLLPDDDGHVQMILEIPSHAGQMVVAADAMARQVVLIANAGEQRAVAGADGAAAKDHFRVAFSRRRSPEAPGWLELHANGNAILDDDTAHQGMGKYGQVGALPDRRQKVLWRRSSAGRSLRHLKETGPRLG